MLRRFAWGTLVLNLGVILWGAFVRATGSGAGCGSHWPTCNGEVVPRAASVETMIELTHRLTSGLALIAVLVMTVLAFRRRPKGHPMRPAAVASLVFILLEAAIGAGIVLLEHVADDASVARVYWMGAHLVNTFLLVGALGLTAWLSPEDAKRPRLAGQGTGPLAIVPLALGAALVAILLVGVTGAVTALGDTLFPAGSLTEGIAEDFSATAHFLVRLRIWHPIAAALSGLFIVTTAVVVALRRPSPETKRLALFVVGLFLAQIPGGFLNLALLAPVWMQLVHLLMADLLWLAVVLLGASALAQPAVAPAPRAEPALTSA